MYVMLFLAKEKKKRTSLVLQEKAYFLYSFGHPDQYTNDCLFGVTVSYKEKRTLLQGYFKNLCNKR